ncbi:MAG: glycosyltransferase, partial [Rubrivivax sp.]
MTLPDGLHASASANSHSSMPAPPLGGTPTRPRIVHLTTVHPRRDIRIFRKECVSLARAGYDVVQVVGDGLGDALVEGVRIVDIGPRPAGRLARMRQQPARALHSVRALEPALVHFHDPELLPVGVRLAREGLKVVYDAHEDVPRQLLTKQWIPSMLRRPLSLAFEAYENRQVRHLSAVVGATPHITQRFSKVARRAVNVSNFPFVHELAPPAEPPAEPPAALSPEAGASRFQDDRIFYDDVSAAHTTRARDLGAPIEVRTGDDIEDKTVEDELFEHIFGVSSGVAATT